MSMVVNHNISSINTLRNLNSSNAMMAKSLQKLSSGYRINVGADGPADLIISEQLRAQTVGLQRAVRNTQEAMNVIGIAEGALTEMNEILKSMRQLALHAANNGITSPEQVAADQSEVDSSIQTIDRIANTTKYSTKFLLNGSQDLTYTRKTTIDRATDHTLLDLGKTTFEQIFKKQGFSVGVTYSGAVDANETYTDGLSQARRAMFETGRSLDTNTDIDATSETTLDADQRFTITGMQGSRTFEFADGTHLGEVVQSINNVADSTGVSGALVFDSDVAGAAQTQQGVNRRTAGTARTSLDIATYHLDSTYQETTGTQQVIANNLGAGLTNLDVGRNTDGFGRMWLKWSSATAFEVYKDEAFTMKIGEGTSGNQISWIRSASPEGNPGDLTFTAANVAAGEVTMVQLGNAHELNGAALGAGGEFNTSLMSGLNISNLADGSNTMSGLQLGYNTDANGTLYFKVETSAVANQDVVSIYKDSAMEDADLVARASALDFSAVGANDITVDLAAVKLNNGAGPSSNLYATLVFDGTNFAAGASSLTGELHTQNLGVRLYSNEYGADEFVKLDVQEGALWSYYKDPDDNTNSTLLDSSAGSVSTATYGQNATVAVNGRQLELDGIGGTVATQDLNAEFVFNEGELGLTTIAQVGYDKGSLYSKTTDINDVGDAANEGNYATNAIHNTSEVINDFVGGMQFQLGEGAGDQERTTYAIRSMAATQLGAVSITDDFQGGGLEETKTLTLQDVLGGGIASLASDPVKALRVIDQAINDVSELRARLGAFQKNMLQTNANSLNVAIENITATESDIRDANMAQETTDFTKNQILVQAGTAMLAQANVASQNVLQLLS